MATASEFEEDIAAIVRSTTVATLLETITLATGMGFATVARVTDARWITCQAVDHIDFGLRPGDELDVETTLCHEVRNYGEEIVIDDVHSDPHYVDHRCPAQYGFRSYISVPIRQADGSFFGTLCAIDPAPRQLKQDRILSMFRLFARMIGEVLDNDTALTQSNAALTQERALAEQQEQFIAILAHDLRNPVNALTAGLRMIERRIDDAQATQLVGLMRASVNRMALLIENLLDQARKRSGGGIIIERQENTDLDAALAQIIAELQAVAPDQQINATIDLPVAINCDAPRISQMFSNLLANAVTHGPEGIPITVGASIEGGDFVLAVTNGGPKIPEQMQPTLFEPFQRGGDRPSREGLGLGLFIASEIAKGHGGTLSVTSTDQQTTFAFRMPMAPAP
ncbi:ATP-binding protein [Loktanella salsilacus]|uniref:GAF domain-containing sensor histidine kinase n=1 Tax=Loktanella salsilacus TaxID=195913 RepID=UPI003736ECA6